MTHAEADKGEDHARRVLASSMLSVLAHGAVVLCSVSVKIAGVTVSEILLILIAFLILPQGMAALRDGTLWPRLAPGMPLMVVALLSVPNAVDTFSALRELVQLLLYVAVGAWVFSEIRACAFGICIRVWAVRAALLLGAALLILPALGLDIASPEAGGTRNALLCNVCLFYALLVSANSGEALRWRRLDRFIMLLVPVLFAVSVSLQAPEESHVSAASMGESPALSQKYIEGYAAMSVLSEYPLFGVGIGNYQARIGEFYQGMPKDNTLLLGTRIGFGVILASIGLLGLTAFSYWLVRLMQETRGLNTQARVLPGFFVVVLVWAFFTPVFVGQVMMPIVFAHGWIMGSRGE
ncbi:MAG: hypothetical protein ACOX5J_06665 [Candidatus Hydrogenedentales bacterium]|jgi:hypothetical protein